MSEAAPALSVRVKLIADLRRHLPAGAQEGVCTLSLPPGTTIRDVLSALGLTEPAALVVLVNGRDATLDDRLSDGDQVAAFPRLAGG